MLHLQPTELGPIIGHGSNSDIFRSKCGKYAIKVLRTNDVFIAGKRKAVGSFQKEFKISSMGIMNTVRAFEFGHCGVSPCYSLEYYDCGTLKREMILEDGPDKYLVPILKALFSLHSRGIIHRDVNESNVFISSSGKISIGDFGVSEKTAGIRKARLSLYKPKYGVGTFPYMPPEQIIIEKGISNACPQNDIWSFGVMAYKMIAGQYPFGEITNDDTSLDEYKENILNCNWDKSLLAKLNVDDKWKMLIQMCLVADWKKRTSSVDQLLTLITSKNGN